MNKLSKNSGFTVVELVITMAIAGVLLGVGVPSFRAFINNSQVTTDSNRFLYDIHFTRSEAVKRSRSVIMCRSTDSTTGNPSCGGTAQDWSGGWLVFVDSNQDGNFTNGTDTLLRVGEGTYAQVKIKSNLVGDSSGGRIIYLGDGRLWLPPGAVAPARYAICDDRDKDGDYDEQYGRETTINAMGNIKTKKVPANCDAPA